MRGYLFTVLLALFALTSCHKSEDDSCIEEIIQRLDNLELVVVTFEQQLKDGMLIKSVTPIQGTPGGWRIEFTGGSPSTIDILNGSDGANGSNGSTPQIEVRQNPDGSSSLWVNDGAEWKDTSVSLTGPKGEPGKPGADGVSPIIEVRDNGNGTITIWYNATRDYPDSSWVNTGVNLAVSSGGGNSPVLSYVDNEAAGTVSFTLDNGKTYTFAKASTAVRFEIMTTRKVTIPLGGTGTIRFVVNPSTAWIPTGDTEDALAMWELNNVETRAGYVNASTNFKIKWIRKSGAGMGEYIAQITCTEATTGVTDYVVALVLNTYTAANPILVSSAPFVLGVNTMPVNLPDIKDVVIPDIGVLASEEHSYVGAFWKNDQTGERLIRIPVSAGNEGNWAVQVYDYGPDFEEGDIVFSTDESIDPEINTDAAADMNTYDGVYQVNGDLTSAGGTVTVGEEIFFRIGLTSEWTATEEKPARYAVILLSYGGAGYPHHQKLFLRQGEGADYVMAENDKDVGGSAPRTGTRRWSPYNLTAAGMAEGQEYVALAPRGGAYVDYPTKAGASFQFSSPNQRYAYHPTMTPKVSLPSWNNNTTTDWSTDQETCPDGYRRPVSGTTRQGSEIAKSLIADLTAKGNSGDALINSTWGYYADGYFDRRPLGLQESSNVGPGDPTLSAVAMNTKDVAYRGRLFFNPVKESDHYNASLFFPAAGTRDRTAGTLYFAGTNGHYWTSNMSGDGNARSLSASKENPSPAYTTYRSIGYSIRCVRENP